MSTRFYHNQKDYIAQLNAMDDLAAVGAGNCVRFDISGQGLTAAQKTNVATNVGLEQVNNTADSAKPLSTASTTALALKAPLASPSFTGGVASVTGGITTVIGADAAGSYIESQGPNNLRLYTNGGERLRVAASGNVLIGTTTDNGVDKLQVNGSVATTGNFALDGGGLTWGSAIYINAEKGTNSLKFNTANAERVRITATGNVGIGTLDPQARLSLGVTTGKKFLAYDGGVANPQLGIGIDMSTANNELALFAGTSNGLNGRISFGRLNTTNSAYTETMSMHASGNLVIGSIVDNGVDKLQVSGSGLFAVAVNESATFSSTAVGGAFITIKNGNTVAGYFGCGKALASPSGGLSDIAMRTNVGNLLFVTTGDIERMRIDASGNLLVGVPSGTTHTVDKAGATVGVKILKVTQQGGNLAVAAFYQVDFNGEEGANAAASALKVGRCGTGRSINMSGSVNALGNDYAEYMVKAASCGTLAKGSIVGVNAAGELTDLWADAVSFMVKTTNPSYVGGDSWGAGLEGDELEAARQTVDRIAFAGQVPVNVQGATPGQFVVPVQEGKWITGITINEDDLTLKQYIKAVGIVQNILPDGRANIRVKVA